MSRITLFAGLFFLFFTGCKGDPDDTEVVTGGGDAEFGEACDGPGQCVEGLACAGDAVCRLGGDDGTLGIGSECASNGICAYGLICSNDGTCSNEGSPGTAAHGDTCTEDTDCQIGLSCPDGACVGVQMPFWPGTECMDPDDETGEFRVYFEVPGEEAAAEFYRMPFPNNTRVLADGTLDLSGHGRPGVLIEQLGDVVGDAYSAMETGFDGFGPNQSVFFRTSHRIDFETVAMGLPGDGTASIVDITPGDPNFGVRASAGWQSHTGRRQYICNNWFELHPTTGRPLKPGHTYAALLTTGIRKRGTNIGAARDPDFDALLSETAPDDARLQYAWEAYQPLRDYIDTTSWPATALSSATVFTVSDPTSYPQRLRASVRNQAELSAITGLVSCEDDNQSYGSADDPDRGCTQNNAFYELQGNVSLPIYQTGTAPFKEASDGGSIDFSFTEMYPATVEQVNFSLTIPKNATMPAEGWPVVLYGHGTGGMYRNASLNGVASNLSKVTLDDATEVNFATFTIDQVLHGPRAHKENWRDAWLELDPTAYDSDVLYFNPLNPTAARDNGLQSAVDWFAITRMFSEGVTVDDSYIGDEIRFDTSHIYYMGHSQGGVAGMNYAPYEADIQAVVMSGTGGLLIESLLNKTNPSNLATAISVGIADSKLTRYHPLLNLVQGYSERADGINHAVHMFADPVDGVPAKDVLHSFGVTDSYSPDETQHALARALRVQQVAGVSVPLENVTEATEEPVTANHAGSGQTALVRLYEPVGGGDGHFVIFDRVDAARQYSHFLATDVRDGVPTLVPATR